MPGPPAAQNTCRRGQRGGTLVTKLSRSFTHVTSKMATTAEICRRHALTRYEFDCLIREGMPYVAGAEDKGGQWQLNPAAVARWLRNRAERVELQRRLYAQRAAERRAEAERYAAARHEAEQVRWRQQREAERQKEVEAQQRRENEARERALYDSYSACFRLAFRAYGVVTGPDWPDRPENQRFLTDWPNAVRGGPPKWWAPPPGMLEFAVAERRREHRFGEPEPDWRQFLVGYEFGTPWPWRRGGADV